MPRMWWFVLMSASLGFGQHRGVVLSDLTWVEAEKVLTPETVVVIPIGAESKEHGPHLKLKTDYLEAEYFKRQILAAFNDGMKHRPETTFGTCNADVLERFDPAFARDNFVDTILNNTWPE